MFGLKYNTEKIPIIKKKNGFADEGKKEAKKRAYLFLFFFFYLSGCRMKKAEKG